MKIETEVRLLDIDINKFILQLNDNKAKFIGDWIQKRKVYDFTPVRENSWIRLRTNGKETTITIKEIKDKSATGTYETEIKVDNFDTADELLNKLGYFARSTQENRRIRYILNNVEIDIDLWPHIPPFVEFEAETEEDIKNVCKALNIDYNSLVTLDVMSIYDYYNLNFHELEKKFNGSLLLESEKKEEITNKKLV